MRGVNLNVFDFDYDLTWVSFFLNADEQVYGRFGGRTPESASAYLKLEGLRYAMSHALETHRRAIDGKKPMHRPPMRTVEQFPAADRLPSKACVHCHHVYDFRREDLQTKGKWNIDEV